MYTLYSFDFCNVVIHGEKSSPFIDMHLFKIEPVSVSHTFLKNLFEKYFVYHLMFNKN